MHVFVCKQKTAYEMRISDWSSYVCSSDLGLRSLELQLAREVVVVSQGQVGLVHQLVEHHPIDPLTLAVEHLLHVGVLLQLGDDLVPSRELGVQDLIRRAMDREDRKRVV